MVDLFDADPQRAAHFSIEVGPLFCDFSKNKIDDETVRLLVSWAESQKLPAAIKALFEGKLLNTTEKRAALHTALRSQDGKACYINGSDVAPEIAITKQKMQQFVSQIRANKSINYIINIGVGGSALGPKMVTRALSRKAGHQRFESYFLSNIDGHVLDDILASCEPSETLVIVTSKTFTTLETMHNADKVKAWLDDAVGEQGANERIVAVTASPERAQEYGVAQGNIFPFWEWVGGRYSLWSAVGLSIALCVGWDRFEKLLAGAAEMDRHFAEAPLDKNLPVILALLGCWYRNWFDYRSHCVVPYDERLKYFVPYLQQLDMESNGKAVGRAGDSVSVKTGPVIWGRPGSNSQHAFFQWLHQGKDIAPVDFIVARKAKHKHPETHQLLVANAIAQAEALLCGKQAPGGQPHRQFDGNRPSNFILLEKLNAFSIGMLVALYEHKAFAQGWLWGVNSFDQWGVELGKHLASTIFYQFTHDDHCGHDASTQGLLSRVSLK